MQKYVSHRMINPIMKENTNNINTLFKSYLTVKEGKRIETKNRNKKVYKLSSNENPIGTSPLAIEAIKNALEDLHLYPDTTDERLREALEKSYNYQLEKDQFICAAGGSELLDLVIRAFVRENDEVIVSTPCFVPYKMFSCWSGAKVIDVPLSFMDYGLNVDGILDEITDKTRIIFLTSPNNPTGSYISKEDFESLMGQLPTNVIVVFDEVYWHFAKAKDYVRALPYISDYPNIVAINSFSKTYGLASLRVGYSYMNKDVATYLRQICKPFLIPKLSLEAAIAAVNDSNFIQKTVDMIHTESAYIEEQFDMIGIEYYPTQANFYLINPPISSDAFIKFLNEEGIAVRPVDNFGANGKVRITIGDREANTALIVALKKIKVNKQLVV